MTRIVSFDLASDLEVQTAAKSAGVDEVGSRAANAITAAFLSKLDRKHLIEQLRSFGYTAVDATDPNFVLPLRAN